MKQRWVGWGVLVLGLALVASVGQPAAADDKDDEGWVQLFNGKDLTGWKIHPKPGGPIVEVITREKDGKVIAFDAKLKDDKTTPLWHVEDGVLIGSGPASHLFSEKNDYADFRFR